jgi:hypothetical protein
VAVMTDSKPKAGAKREFVSAGPQVCTPNAGPGLGMGLDIQDVYLEND